MIVRFISCQHAGFQQQDVVGVAHAERGNLLEVPQFDDLPLSACKFSVAQQILTADFQIWLRRLHDNENHCGSQINVIPVYTKVSTVPLARKWRAGQNAWITR
jgi:hypothetical protein